MKVDIVNCFYLYLPMLDIDHDINQQKVFSSFAMLHIDTFEAYKIAYEKCFSNEVYDSENEFKQDFYRDYFNELHYMGDIKILSIIENVDIDLTKFLKCDYCEMMDLDKIQYSYLK